MAGVEHSHKNGYCHRDLKLANLLLGKDFTLKLADFGYSSLIEGERGQDKLLTIVGTRGFMAPELINEQPYNGEVVDLFASAVILFMMKNALPPFMEADRRQDPYYKKFCKKPKKWWQFHGSSKPGKMSYFDNHFIDLITKMF